MIPQERVTHIYERNAPVYDLMESPLEWLAARRWRPRLASGLHGRVLELGIGTGRNLPHFPAQVQLTAIDPSPAMLERARRRARRLARPVEFVTGAAQALPFDGDSFDAVVASFVFCSAADPMKGLQEARRVLRPGGTLRLLEHQRPPGAALARLFDLMDPLAFRVTGAHLNRGTDAAVKRAGFQSVRSEALEPLGIFRLITARKRP